jgi:hypothetical protein
MSNFIERDLVENGTHHGASIFREFSRVVFVLPKYFVDLGFQLVFFGSILQVQKPVEGDTGDHASPEALVLGEELFQDPNLQEAKFRALLFAVDLRAPETNGPLRRVPHGHQSFGHFFGLCFRGEISLFGRFLRGFFPHLAQGFQTPDLLFGLS